MPVAALSALARDRGCLSVVDGAQAIGGIGVDLKALDCDAYATSGHKWLLAPKGTGLLFLRQSLAARIDPIALQSGRQGYTASSGVCSIPSVLGLGDAIDYLNAIGLTKVEQHNRALRDYAYAALARLPQLTITSPPPGAYTTGMVSYVLPDAIKAGALHDVLRTKYKIQIKVVPGNFFNGHRVSTHLFNTERDVDTLVGALRKELA
jgi:selenocysteine lyase/cysteine desulfurase